MWGYRRLHVLLRGEGLDRERQEGGGFGRQNFLDLDPDDLRAGTGARVSRC